jgi:hypothetical protein
VRSDHERVGAEHAHCEPGVDHLVANVAAPVDAASAEVGVERGREHCGEDGPGGCRGHTEQDLNLALR